MSYPHIVRQYAAQAAEGTFSQPWPGDFVGFPALARRMVQLSAGKGFGPL